MCNCAFKPGDKVKFRDIVAEVTGKKDQGDYCDLDLIFERNGIESEITVSCKDVEKA
jgi:hypothetical protein